uniref:Serpin-3 n=1 Tax=Nilaparvata lugens TaxID=108931 RepID=M9ZRP7_NILLU|nr:serpin-3 [Nilaparvata lugens]
MKQILAGLVGVVFVIHFSTKTVICLPEQSNAHQNALAGKLYNALAENKTANIFFSPFSISYALSALLMGTEGDAFKELQNALSLPPAEVDILKAVSARFTQVLKGDENMTVANGFFVDRNFEVKEKFLNHLKNDFHAESRVMNLSANPIDSTLQINKWVENKTSNIIKDLLPKEFIDKFTVAVLVNAVYFKSKWIHPFDKNETKVRPFYALDKVYETEMMLIRRKLNYKFSDDLQSHIILMPYVGNYRMVLLVPKETDGIVELDAKLKKGLEGNSTTFLDSFATDVEKTKLKLAVPKCKLEVKTDLKELLQKIGVKSIFTNGYLGKISDDPRLFVSDAVHKANLNIDEISTEAAAATGIGISNRTLYPRPITIKADRPFVFAIVHKVTKTIIFVGRLSHF